MEGNKPNCSDYRTIKTRRIGLAGHIARMGGRRNGDRITNYLTQWR
jgi:hypothetical protein